MHLNIVLGKVYNYFEGYHHPPKRNHPKKKNTPPPKKKSNLFILNTKLKWGVSRYPPPSPLVPNAPRGL